MKGKQIAKVTGRTLSALGAVALLVAAARGCHKLDAPARAYQEANSARTVYLQPKAVGVDRTSFSVVGRDNEGNLRSLTSSCSAGARIHPRTAYAAALEAEAQDGDEEYVKIDLDKAGRIVDLDCEYINEKDLGGDYR